MAKVNINYPSNSILSTEPVGGSNHNESPPPVVVTTIQGKVVKKKQSLTRRVIGALVGADDMQTIPHYILWDVVIPGARNFLAWGLHGMIDTILPGNGQRTIGSPIVFRNGQSQIAYNKISSGNSGPTPPIGAVNGNKQSGVITRKGSNLQELHFETRGDAEAVLSDIFERINTYNIISVADVYEMCQLSFEYTDRSWGWYNTNNMGVTRLTGGWFRLYLPEPVPLQ